MRREWKLFRWKPYLWVVYDPKRGPDDLSPQDTWMPSFYQLLPSEYRKGSAQTVVFSDADFPGRDWHLVLARELHGIALDYRDESGESHLVQKSELIDALGEAYKELFIKIS